MKISISFVISICFSLDLMSQVPRCDAFYKITERLLNEKLFYSNQLDLSFVDTITILNITNTLNDCNCNKVFNVNLDPSLYKTFSYEGVKYETKLLKTVVLKTHDVIPWPLIGTWDCNKGYSEKYKNYLVLQRFEDFGNLKLIKLFKVLSNHNIILSYKYIDGKLELVDYEVGQY
jgi:hypothetical protein